ncbi:MAG: zf-HC2 domain-containing protein [Candidatus Omnitrophica bacterium]|nr:zf-HC2 domain-containing protein [Candidatus Omnitrophota bacterium]
MNLHKNIKILSLYMDGELDKRLADSVAAHLETCEECRAAVERLKETKKLLSGTQPVQPPANLAKQIMERIPREKPSALPVKRFYVPALGTLALLIAASLVMFNRSQVTQRAQGLQTAKAPVNEKTDGVIEETAPSSLISKAEKPAVFARSDADMAKEKTDEFSVREKGVAASEKLRSAEEFAVKKEEVSNAERKSAAPAESAEGEFCYIGGDGKTVCEDTSGKTAISLAAKTAGMARKAAFPNAIVIRDGKEWNSIWNTQNTAQNLTLPLPDVNFKEKMVVAVPSIQADNEYTVVNTLEEKDKIIIQYKEQPLQKTPLPPYQLNVVNQKPSVEFQKID